jgi:hypothetical protein
MSKNFQSSGSTTTNNNQEFNSSDKKSVPVSTLADFKIISKLGTEFNSKHLR